MINHVKKQFLFLITVTVVGGLVILIIVILPAVKTITGLERDITHTQEFLEKQYEKTQRLKRSFHEIESILTTTKTLEEAGVKVGNELKIITQLEDLAEAHSIKQTLNVSFTDPKKDGEAKNKSVPDQLKQLPYYTFSFLNNGSYEAHLSYLKDMEKMNYYFIISSMQWENRQQGQANGDITVRFDATLYVTQ